MTLGDQLINQYTIELVHKYPFLFGEKQITLQTFPNTQFYTLPTTFRKINTVVINVSGTTTTTASGFNWPVMEAPSVQFWNNANLVNNITSDVPQYFILLNGRLGIYPKPANGYNPMYVQGQAEVTDLSIPDITAGSITTVPYVSTLTATLNSTALTAVLNSSWTLPTATYQMITSAGDNKLVAITNGSTTISWTSPLTASAGSTVTIRTQTGGDIVVGTGTSWATSMQGYVFSITEATGDGFWYTIDTVYNTTTLSLLGYYQGNPIASGTATYTIGQASILPPAYQFIPIYRATEFYFTVISKDEGRAAKFRELAERLTKQLEDDYGNKTSDPTIQDAGDKPVINPNLTVNLTQSSTKQ